MAVVTALLLLAGFVHAAPPDLSQPADGASAYITYFDNNFNDNGEYSFDVTSSDGQQRGETRKVLNIGTENEIAVIEGYYSYIAPDGEKKTVYYRADENGFYAEGEHLPPSANVKGRHPLIGISSAAAESLAFEELEQSIEK